MIYDSILDTIGRTPIVRLHRLAPAHVTLYAKVESFNPGGSVKDRLAIAVILDAEQKGLLKPGAEKLCTLVTEQLRHPLVDVEDHAADVHDAARLAEHR